MEHVLFLDSISYESTLQTIRLTSWDHCQSPRIHPGIPRNPKFKLCQHLILIHPQYHKASQPSLVRPSSVQRSDQIRRMWTNTGSSTWESFQLKFLNTSLWLLYDNSMGTSRTFVVLAQTQCADGFIPSCQDVPRHNRPLPLHCLFFSLLPWRHFLTREEEEV